MRTSLFCVILCVLMFCLNGQEYNIIFVSIELDQLHNLNNNRLEKVITKSFGGSSKYIYEEDNWNINIVFYDSLNMVKKSIWYPSNDTLRKSHQVYLYDEKLRDSITFRIETRKEDTTSIEVIIYENDENLAEIRTLDVCNSLDGDIKQISIRDYRDLTYAIYYCQLNGEIYRNDEFRVERRGDTIYIPTVVSYQEKRIYNNNGDVTYLIKSIGDSIVSERTTVYNYQGLKKEEFTINPYDINGWEWLDCRWKYKIKYDRNSNPVKIRGYIDRKLVLKLEMDYEFDEMGNWIQRKTYLNKNIWQKELREISYIEE